MIKCQVSFCQSKRFIYFIFFFFSYPFQCIAILIQLILVFPIIGFPMIPLLHAGSDLWNKRAVIFFLVFLCVLTLIAVMPTGAENPGCWQKFVRYAIFNEVKLVT